MNFDAPVISFVYITSLVSIALTYFIDVNADTVVLDRQGNATALPGKKDLDMLTTAVLHRVKYGFLGNAVKMA